jgi:FADH2 O2-dependent halogenase
LLTGTRRTRPLRISATFVADASGPRGFLSRALDIRDRGFDGYPPTQALFSHFAGVARCDDMPEFGVGGGLEGPPLRLENEAGARSSSGRCGGPSGPADPPYPADDAALHHVFDGGWMWVLRFGNGVTSAGIAVTDALAADLRLSDGEPAWRRFLARYPSIAAQFAGAAPIRAFTWMPRLAWRAEVAAGPAWAMLPSAAAFVDPLFSTGFPLTLLGIERIARILEGGSTSNLQLPPPPSPVASGVGCRELGVWDHYSESTLAEADHTAAYIAGCYAAFPRFDQFAAYSMFYFAAASYGESARRLGFSAPARFLAADHPQFGEASRRLSPARTSLRGRDYTDAVAGAVRPLNIAGLCDPDRRNWYPAIPILHASTSAAV